MQALPVIGAFLAAIPGLAGLSAGIRELLGRSDELARFVTGLVSLLAEADWLVRPLAWAAAGATLLAIALALLLAALRTPA